MGTIGALILLLLVGVFLLLLIIGLAIALGYIQRASVWVMPPVDQVAQQGTEQIRQHSRATRRAMDLETERYYEELYQAEVAAIEAEYELPTTRKSK